MSEAATLLSGDPAATAAAATSTTAATTQATAATPWNWADESGKFSDGWVDKLPEGLRGEASLRVIPDLPTLASTYVSTKKMVGAKALEMPGEGAPAEQVAAWRKLHNAPEAPEGYLGEAKTLRPDAVPEALWDKSKDAKWAGIFHKHSLPPAAVQDIINEYAADIKGGLENNAEAEKAFLIAEGDKLKQAWGADAEANANIAKRMALTMGLEPTNPIFQNADVVMAFAKASKLFSEDKLVTGDPASALGGSIQERISDITSPTSQSFLAKAYRGEINPQAQADAQKQLHGLYAAQQQK